MRSIVMSSTNETSTLQSMLLGLYALVRRSGFLSTSFGRWLFETAYEVYKELLEAGEVKHLTPYITPGSTVIDVGANVGFFTRRFARWAGDNGRIIAVEAEDLNYQRLLRRIEKEGLTKQVDPLHAAVAEKPGTLMLQLNPDHPGDHKLGEEGVPVKAVTLDGLMEERNWPEVSFIKIDVQGAEMRVFAGAKELLSKMKPALFVEVDDAHLKAQGTDAKSLIQHLMGYGYAPHKVEKTGISNALGEDEAVALVSAPGSYLDFLFLVPEKK